jgi:polyphenol oxidase
MPPQAPDLILPDWPAPSSVRALMTTRDVDLAALDLPSAPRWLRQVHGTAVARLSAKDCRPTAPESVGRQSLAAEPEADASVTTEPDVVCVVKSADCLPVLLCDDRGSVVGAAHAGWRGLAAGVLEATVAAMGVAPDSLMAWMGAAIGPASFEVGAEVRAAFLARDPAAAAHFTPHPAPGKFLADLYGLARQRLGAAGVARIHGGGFDTLADPRRFFSYRRDGRTGRMAALVYLNRQSPQQPRASE